LVLGFALFAVTAGSPTQPATTEFASRGPAHQVAVDQPILDRAPASDWAGVAAVVEARAWSAERPAAFDGTLGYPTPSGIQPAAGSPVRVAALVTAVAGVVPGAHGQRAPPGGRQRSRPGDRQRSSRRSA
jgi:hypothetical protein